VLHFFYQVFPEEAPVPEESQDDAGEPCPACDWAPAVTEIVEVIVESWEDLVRLESQGWKRKRQRATTNRRHARGSRQPLG
jgi:hypothetical protein